METIYNDIETRFKICEDIFKKGQNYQDAQMTSSTVSSLSSPVDSGVQMLDSESELTSVMSVSGLGCDTDVLPESDVIIKNVENLSDNVNSDIKLNLLADKEDHKNIEINDYYTDTICEKEDSGKEGKSSHDKINRELASKHSNCGHGVYDLCSEKNISKEAIDKYLHSSAKKPNIQSLEENKDLMVKDDCVNQIIKYDYKNISTSVPNYFDKFDIFEVSSNPSDGHKLESKNISDDVFEMEHPIKNTESDLMNVSLNSYELLDYTLQNVKLNTANTDMHVSLSEEVNENLKINLNCPVEAVPPLSIPETIPAVENKDTKPLEEQIVFRRQRKKKSKSDTPKKRVSFHEDILNSTKIDDIHINHGFITHEPDVSLSFFQRGFIRKPDVVKGRYSWAAEGDAPYYEKNVPEREIKSDIYIHHPRYSSTSSSSTASVSSSIDEEDNSNSDENYVRKEPSLKSKPKSSCLKKRSTRKYIDTNIVQEENNLKKKKSETNLLDTNILGSLKNILNFSTSVPLAERGVPEGQEDVTVYSSSVDVTNRRRSFGSLSLKNFETIEIKPAPVNKVLEAKTNLKLTKSEGFYPNYPNIPQNLPANIILCDSNVYEHKGISYSYEYDNFQKNFERENKPKSSTVYQMILKELNFFRRRAKDEPEVEGEEDFEVINNTSTPTKNDNKIEEVQEPEFKESRLLTKNNSNKYSSTTKMDWSDNETISDFSEPQNPRHLSSPKRKVTRNNHYSVSQSFKVPLSENRGEDTNDTDTSRSLPSLRPSTSKTSLISRFLRNVTLKKMIDVKVQNKQKSSRRLMSLYIKGIKSNKVNDDLDKELEKEIALGQEKRQNGENLLDKKMIIQFRKELFRSRLEKLIKVFPVRSAYTTNGETKPLLVILTDSTLYIAGMKPNSTYCNHFVLPYTELNTVLIGPNAQTIHLSNYDKDMQCIISTGCSNLTGDLVGQLEIAMRRDMNKPRLPAVKQLSMRDMVNLRRAICKQTSVEKDEEYFYYSIVNIQDFISDMEPTPLGPTKEGPLMFKTSESESSRWETAYFILKAGVLYMLSSASQRVPLSVFPLINGSCQGARRIFNSHRPHTFQLIVEEKSLLLAAPDEYVASEWLQELVHAASGTYSPRDKNPTQSCSLLMTSDHILTVREAFPYMVSSLLPAKSQHDPIKGTQALSCASIIDLTSFRLPSAEQSWCIMEFACREVHEYTGDWILYFSSNAELENFLSTLENLWEYNNENGDSFPLTTIPETDPLSKKCVDVYTSLIGTWPSNTVLLQFVNLQYAFRLFTRTSHALNRNNILLIIIKMINIFPILDFVVSGLAKDLVIVGLNFGNTKSWAKDVKFSSDDQDRIYLELLISAMPLYMNFFGGIRVLEEQRIVYHLLSISRNKSAIKWNPQQVCVLSHLALDTLMKIVPFMEEEFIENSGAIIFLNIIRMYKTKEIDILILGKCLEALLHILKNTLMVLDSVLFNDGINLILGLCEDIVFNSFEDNFGKKCLTLAFLLLNMLYGHSTQKFMKKVIAVTTTYMKKLVTPRQEFFVRDIREIICVINFIWEHIVQDEVFAKEFVKNDGAFLMLDMIQKFPFVVKVVTLGALVDLCEFDYCIPYLITWKRNGEKILPMLMRLFRAENKKLKVKTGSHGQISDTRYPLMGKDQWFLTFCTCKPMTPGDACISDLFISYRPKIYALLQMLHMRHAETVEIADEHYKSYCEELQPIDQVTRLVAENFLALKLGEAWVELNEEFERSSITLTSNDNKLLCSLTERSHKLAQYLQSVQNEIIQNTNEKELFKEYKLYKHLANGKLTDALEALSELKTIARSSEHMFRISEKFKQNKQIDDAVKSHNIQSHRTYFATIRATPVFNQTVNLTKIVSAEETDLVPISPIESKIECDIDDPEDLLQ